LVQKPSSAPVFCIWMLCSLRCYGRCNPEKPDPCN
jgi:hypothetical protein